MSTASLKTTIAPLQIFLQAKHIQEIMINRPDEIWLDDGQKITSQGIDLPLKLLKRLVDLIAAQSGQELSELKPLLSATLPGGHRVQIISSPAVKLLDSDRTWQDTVAISIRKQTQADLDLETFAKNQGFSECIGIGDSSIKNLQMLYESKQYLKLFIHAIKCKKTILVSGGTYSGKTTLLNMLIKKIDKTERIVTIEDTPELHIDNGNQVRLFYSRGKQDAAKLNPYDLLNAALRMRPDRIVMGELREDDAYCWLQAANTGHKGTLSTIHSDTPLLAVQKLTDMVRMKYPLQSDESIKQYIYSVVDIIIQIKRDATTGKRVVSDILLLNA